MAVKTDIEWCDHTYNPWWGCEKISPECARCYAAAFAKRLGLDIWGAGSPRRFFGDAHWREPLKWNRDAEKAGTRRTVFCASMADVFEDRRDLDVHRARLWSLIEATPYLEWLLLTKRPEHMTTFTPRTWAGGWPSNVWAGTTIGHRDSMHRLAQLRGVPARVRFVSAEPLLTPLDFGEAGGLSGIDWLIVGGESGRGFKTCDPAWFDPLIVQCRAAAVAVFVKQDAGLYPGRQGRLPDAVWRMKEWPAKYQRTVQHAPVRCGAQLALAAVI